MGIASSRTGRARTPFGCPRSTFIRPQDAIIGHFAREHGATFSRNKKLEADTAEIIDFPTHKEISSRVNTHREAVTRELNELSKVGLIHQEQRVLKVSSVSNLDDFLHDSL